ncbi:MAG: hypothetical protein HQK86_05825 [Nitrospinae bacterium]|nr:hypothetical protein [Nitrospinota bacterium]MBF0635152.1 hypothetical protein [Nitrospinota bacterium]
MGKIIIFLTVFLAPSLCFAGSISTYKVSFKTLACDGTQGLASIDADRLMKIETVKCDPNDALKEVWQVLVTGEPGSKLTYRVFSTTKEEAEKVQKEIDNYQGVKKKSLEKSDRLIINK